MAAADQHGVQGAAHAAPLVGGLWYMVNNCCISNRLYKFLSVISERNDGRHVRPLRRRRSCWRPFPRATALGLGAVVAAGLGLRDVHRAGQRDRPFLLMDPDTQWHIVAGKWIMRTAACPPSIPSPSPSAASPGSPRSGCRSSRSRRPSTRWLGGRGRAHRRRARVTFALLLRLLLRDLAPLPALIVTVTGVV